MATNKIFIPYYISSNTGAPAQVLPRVFFYNGLKESDPYWIQHWTTSSFGKTVIAQQYESFPYFDNYSGQETTTSSLSLLFLNEDVAYGNSVPSQSLYDLYWAKYVDLLYNPRTRIIRLSAVLPFPVYQKLELNDVIQLRSNYYHLRAINDYNLKTGECRMELLGPLLEGSLNNQFTFDNTCEQAPTLYGSVLFNTSSQVVTFGITGSNCCNNPNYVTIKIDYATGSCPATPTNTIYETVPNSYPINIDMFQALAGSPGVNCVTMSVANLCYGLGVTGSYTLVFSGTVSGSYGNTTISGSAQKSGCGTCETGSIYTTIVAANTFSSSISQSIAQASASAYLTSVTQSNANTFGSCSYWSYYSTAISASVQKNDCTTCLIPSYANVILPASYSFDSCSQATAQSIAQTYFNSISQSQANISGSCLSGSSASGTLYCVTASITFQTDAISASLYPISLSVLTTASGSSIPSESDSNWAIFGIMSSSQNLADNSYNYPIPIISASGNTVWLKARGVNNSYIQYVGLFSGTTFMADYAPTTGSKTLPLESKPKLYNNYTQSLGGGYDLPFNLILSGSMRTSQSISYMTASFIYTSSNNYPSLSDLKWTDACYYETSPSGDGLEGVIYNGSFLKTNVDVYVSQSNYYYFKFTNNLGNLVPFTSASVQSAASASVVSNISQSRILQAEFTKSVQTDNAFINFKVY